MPYSVISALSVLPHPLDISQGLDENPLPDCLADETTSINLHGVKCSMSGLDRGLHTGSKDSVNYCFYL